MRMHLVQVPRLRKRLELRPLSLFAVCAMKSSVQVGVRPRVPAGLSRLEAVLTVACTRGCIHCHAAVLVSIHLR